MHSMEGIIGALLLEYALYMAAMLASVPVPKGCIGVAAFVLYVGTMVTQIAVLLCSLVASVGYFASMATEADCLVKGPF